MLPRRKNFTMAQLNPFILQLLVVMGILASTSVSLAKPPPQAQEHLEAGLAYFDDPAGPRYEEAYREFHAAYEAYPSYRLLANIGTCALFLERDEEAIKAYEGYLAKATQSDIPAKKRALMEKDIKTLKASLVRLSISVSPPRVTLIDERFATSGKSVVNRYEITDGTLNLGIHPGDHRITAHREGYEDQSWEIEAKPASSHSHEFKLAERETAPTRSSARDRVERPEHLGDDPEKSAPIVKHRPTPTSVYVGLGVTGLLAVGTGVAGVLTLSKRSDYIDANDGAHVSEASALRDDLNTYLLVTAIAGGATVLAGGITTYLYATRPSVDVTRDRNSNLRLVPVVSTDRAGVSLSGQF